jgi:predicted 3-demethylubiquinone-9 3-methyltransferase (glyoxalase superfamily)
MQKITPFLWFNDQAEAAMNSYLSVFTDSKVKEIVRYGDAGPGPKGTVMVAYFQIRGQDFAALNGGPMYSFTPAISFVLNCETQAEVDELWEKLVVGSPFQQCGWLTDQFGVSWQIVPTALPRLLNDPNPE